MSFFISLLSKRSANDVPSKVLSDSSAVSAKAIMDSFVFIEDYDPKFLTARRIVTQLTPLIENKAQTEGLYRISASIAPLRVFFETLKSDPKVVVPPTADAHTLTGVLTLALRELDPKLLQCQLPLLLEAAQALTSAKAVIGPDSEQAMRNVAMFIKEAIEPLPKEKALCVKTLFVHLHNISLSAAANKMDAKNLSTIFTPLFVDCDLEDIHRFIALFAYLIEHPEVLQRA